MESEKLSSVVNSNLGQTKLDGSLMVTQDVLDCAVEAELQALTSGVGVESNAGGVSDNGSHGANALPVVRRSTSLSACLRGGRCHGMACTNLCHGQGSAQSSPSVFKVCVGLPNEIIGVQCERESVITVGVVCDVNGAGLMDLVNVVDKKFADVQGKGDSSLCRDVCSEAVKSNVLQAVNHIHEQRGVLVVPQLPVKPISCNEPSCVTCKAMHDVSYDPLQITCPVASCVWHNKKEVQYIFPGIGDKVKFKSWEVMAVLRNHIVKCHSKDELLNVCKFNNVSLARLYRVVACKKQYHCGVVFKISAQIKPPSVSSGASLEVVERHFNKAINSCKKCDKQSVIGNGESSGGSTGLPAGTYVATTAVGIASKPRRVMDGGKVQSAGGKNFGGAVVSVEGQKGRGSMGAIYQSASVDYSPSLGINQSLVLNAKSSVSVPRNNMQVYDLPVSNPAGCGSSVIVTATLPPVAPVIMQQPVVAAIIPNVVGEAPQLQPNQAFPVFLSQACVVVDRYVTMQDLPQLPPIFQQLPVGNKDLADGLAVIFEAISDALRLPDLSPRDELNLWKVWALLPRFLFLGNCKNSRGDQVAVTVGVAKRVSLFVLEGGPDSLWDDHIRVCQEMEYNRKSSLGQAPGSNATLYQDEYEAQAEGVNYDKVRRCMNAADISAAFSELTGDYVLYKMSSADAECMLKAKYIKEERDIGGDIQRILDQQVADGNINAADLLIRLPVENVRHASSKFTPIGGPDEAGWRPYVVKQIMRADGAVCALSGMEAFVELLSGLVSNAVPAAASCFFNSIGMESLVRKGAGIGGISADPRLINPPMVLARLAFGAGASMESATWNKYLGAFQVACGAQGGSELLSKASEVILAYGHVLREEKYVMVKGDFKGFYYRADRREVINTLVKLKMWNTLVMYQAAFGDASRVKVIYRNALGDRVVFSAPTGGFPPGHPLSGVLAALPVKTRYDSAMQALVTKHLVLAGSPEPDSVQHNSILKRVVDKQLAIMFVDDGNFISPIDDATLLLGTFSDTCERDGVAVFAPLKTEFTPVGGWVMTLQQQVDLSIAMAPIAVRDAYRRKVAERGAQQEGREFGEVVLPDAPFEVAPIVDHRAAPEFNADGSVISGKGGSKIVGACFGNERYMEYQAKRLGAVVAGKMENVAAYQHNQATYLLTRVCAAGLLNSTARAQGSDPRFVEHVYKPFDQCVRMQVAKSMGQQALDPVQCDVAVLPLKQGGGGMRSVSEGAEFAWLASWLNMANWVRKTLPRDNILHSLVMRAMEYEGDNSDLAARLLRCTDRFFALFRAAKGREVDLAIDGFAPSFNGLLSVAAKFQGRVAALIAEVRERELAPRLIPSQRSALVAQQVKGAASILVAIPVEGSTYSMSNPEFMQYMQRRFLKPNFNANFGVNGSKCAINGCQVPLSDQHLEVCVRSSICTVRSEALKKVVLELLQYAGVLYDGQDLKFNKHMWQRLAVAGAITPSGHRVADVPHGVGGMGTFDGADLLARSLLADRDEVAVDVTVISERIEAAQELHKAEQNKINLYHRMYEPIGVSVLGIAMNLTGTAGPAMVNFVKRCCTLAAGRPLPNWANWSAGTSSVGAWLQRMACAVQVASAHHLLGNVAISRAAHAGKVAAGAGARGVVKVDRRTLATGWRPGRFGSNGRRPIT